MTADRASIVLACATALDRLGHGEMFQELHSCLDEAGNYQIIAAYALSVNLPHRIDIPLSVEIPVGIIANYYTVETKNYLFGKFGSFGLLIFFAIRFYAITGFYFKLYRSLQPDTTVVDLEYEPIQSKIALFLSGRSDKLKHFSVVHSFPGTASKGLKSRYKSLCLKLIKGHIASGNMIGVMTRADFELAVDQGIPDSRLALVGWGLNPKHAVTRNSPTFISEKQIRFVCPGVLRRGKKIDSVISFFASLDDPEISLVVAGAPIDVDVAGLQKMCAQSPSATTISIEPRYFEKNEFDDLFACADVIVLSHDSQFHSMSGPLLQALHLRKPILCFSQNNVSKIVSEADAGLIASFGDRVTPDLVRKIKNLRGHRYDLDDKFPFTWASISRRIVECLDRNSAYKDQAQ